MSSTVIGYIFAGVYTVISLILVTIILMQQGKPQGLGAITGSAVETYWTKNKGRSREGMQRKITVVLSVLFFILSLLIDMKLF